MKKKSLTALFIACIFLLTACGESSGQDSQENKTESKEGSVKLALSVGNYSGDSVMGMSMNKMAELIEEYSEGSVTCDVYTDNSLGDLSSQVDALVNGSIDILVAGDSYYSTYAPQMQIFELPFLYESNEEARHVLDGEAGEKVADLFEGTGINILRYWELGMRQLTNSKKEIRSMDDMKGLRLRVLPVEIQVFAWETYGAEVFTIDGSELYSSLQTGVVDAQENPLEGIWTNKIYEVQPYITLTNHVFTPAALAISEKTESKLSDAQMEAVRKAADEATDFLRENMDVLEQEALEELRNECTICEEPDLSGFTENAPLIYEKFEELVPSAKELFDVIYSSRDEFRGN